MPKKRMLSFAAAIVMLLTLVFPANFLIVNAAGITPEEFLANPVESSHCSVYNSADAESSFNMNGRTYYQGIRFIDSSKISSISFDVTDIDSISFTAGHVDNTSTAGAELQIYLDSVLYDIISLAMGNPLVDYDLPLKGKSDLSFTLTRDNYSNSDYAIADISVDSAAPATVFSTPEYSSSEDFLSTSFDTSKINTYTSGTEFFNINGRRYYQGVVFNGTSKYSSLSFNVENINDISFTIGHIDDTANASAVLSIYADGILYDEIKLWMGKKWTKYELDTTGKSMIRFVLTRDDYSDSQYAIADVTADGNEPAATYSTPEYSSSENFLISNYDNFKCEVYNSTSKVYAFNVNGRTYYEGITFTGTSKYSYISYNVENVNNISFNMGHIDSTDRAKATLSIYLDDVLYDEIELWYGKPTEKYELDTSKKSIVKFMLTRENYSDSQYALADFVVDGADPSMEKVIPSYKSSEDMLNSNYDNYNCAVYSASSKVYSFNMNGRTYYQGIAFTGTSKYSYLTFNVENVNDISFTMGHIDNTARARAVLEIYLDDTLYDKISLWSGKPLADYKLNTSGKSTLKFVLTRDNYSDSQYALADVTVDGAAPAIKKVIPQYETAEEILNAAFDSVCTKIYDNTSKVYSFIMNGETYYQGLTFIYSDKISEASFNVENVGSLSFKLGHVDETGTVPATLKIICDDWNAIEIPLTAADETRTCVLDTTQFSTVRFYLQRSNYSTSDYALADVSLTAEAPDKSDPNILEFNKAKGDINNDSEVNIFDVILLRRMILNKAAYDSSADLNNDGSISVADLVEFNRFILCY